MTEPQNLYGFKYFDKLNDYNEEDDEEEDESASCPTNCCDHDCECDDCERCSMNGTTEPESLYEAAAS